MDFRFYLSLFLRRLHWFLLMAVLCAAIGITLARVLPTVYIGEATLVVESEQIPDSLAASTVQTQATEQLEIIQQRILARDTLVEMANRLQIYGPASGQRSRPMDADELVADLRARISIVTSGGPVVRGPTQATLVKVSFEAPTAALAAAVTNDVVTLILKTDVEMRTGAARQTLDFFQQDVTRLDKDLADRGAAIVRFKEAHKTALPDSLEFRRNQQAIAQERLLQVQRDEADLRDRRDRLVHLHEAAGGADDLSATSGKQTPEQKQLAQLTEQLNGLLVVLSPENPKIKLLQTQIAGVQKVVAAQGGGDGQQLSAYDVQLSDLEGQLASLTMQQTQIEAQMQTLQTAIEATPSNAIALDALQRDYDNVRAQYDQAVANRARAETGDTIEAMSKGQRISVIEQAVAPKDPARPNRPVIAAAGVGGGIVLGFALVALLTFLSTGIRRPVDLTAKLGITVFATLPYLQTAREIRRRRLRRLAIVAAVLVVVAALLWAVNTYYMPLDLLMDQLVQRLSLLSGPGQVQV